jgi:NAD(P)-dependent dehydrogenase (short-subunit alcohol dehydrogenase family)
MSGAPPLPSFTKKWYKNTYPAIDPSRPELSAAGKIIVVTGAGSGIGAAIAIAFAKAGADGIALIGRREHTLAQTNSTIKKNYPQVNVLVATGNVSSKASIDDAFNKISSTFGKIDVFVPNAGSINPPGPVATLDGEAWFECFKINTLGSLYSTQAFIPHAATNAYILNISSGIIHFPPFPGMSGYATSKLAGTKLFDYVQAENPELHVVNIQPGIIDTDVNRISGMPPLDTGIMILIPS